MGDVKLFCLIQGESLEQCFQVKLSRESNINDLRNCIITECADELEGVAARHILLYCVSIADSSEIPQLSLKNTLPLHPRTTIGKLFPDGPGENDYILVANGMMRSYLCFAMLI